MKIDIGRRDAIVVGTAVLLVTAAVVAYPGAPWPTLEEIKEFLTLSLDTTAAPREMHFVDELPRRGIGKIDRKALRERYSGGDVPGSYGW